jgi:hypothetical protein
MWGGGSKQSVGALLLCAGPGRAPVRMVFITKATGTSTKQEKNGQS